jgi:hypothetical protein
LPEEDAERIQQHLAGCGRCVDALRGLEPRDTLVEAMRAQGDVAARSEEEVVEELAARLGGLPPPAAGHTAAATVDQPSAECPGTIIGPYKLIEPIGEGGMGTVWMAQQTKPVKRLVALKLIKAGMDSKQVIARFEAERQALALMDHPNIAKVFDGGMISSPLAPREVGPPHGEREGYLGRPYFVMELVKGIAITKYCDEHHLTPRQRLELLATRAMNSTRACSSTSAAPPTRFSQVRMVAPSRTSRTTIRRQRSASTT